MHDRGVSRGRFAELYARARAARVQAQASRREFIETRQNFRELRERFVLAYRRAELVRDLWIAAPGPGVQARYTARAQMTARLASMSVIEQAKGIIMAQCGWTADQAFDALRQASQRTNIKVRVLAAQLVANTVGAASRPSPQAAPPGSAAGTVLKFPELGTSSAPPDRSLAPSRMAREATGTSSSSA